MEDLIAAVNAAWSGESVTLDASTEYGDRQEGFSAARVESARPRRQKPA